MLQKKAGWPVDAELTDRQKRRKRRIEKVCALHGTIDHANLPSFDPVEYYQILVDDTRRILYCEINKAACTNWKRILLVLTGKMNTTRPKDLNHYDVHHDLEATFLPRLYTFPTAGIRYRLDNYFKFVFVREPIERFLSAFLDKFTFAVNDLYRQEFGRKIIARYRKHPSKASLANGSDVTLKEFVEYLLDPETRMVEGVRPHWYGFDPHWRAYYQQCHPCLVPYDFVGKYETLSEDVDHLLKLLGVYGSVEFPVTKTGRNKTSDYMKQMFASISAFDVQRLWELYSHDYSLFGYKYPSFLLDQ